MSDIRQDQFDSDFDFVRQRLAQDARQIELPPSLRSENLLSLLDGLPEDSEEPQPCREGGRSSKRTIYLQFVACAACFTLVFFGFYKVVEYTANGNLVTAPAPHAASATPRDPVAPTPNGNETAPAAAAAAAPKMQADTAPKAEPAAEQPTAKSYGEVFQTLGGMLPVESVPSPKPQGNPMLGSANAPMEQMDSAVRPNLATGGGPTGATPVSRTNTQFDDVDEADLVKTDGRYLYQYRFDSASGEAEVAIVGATNLQLMSTIPVDKSESGADAEMYLLGDHLVLVQSAAQERVDETLAPLDTPMIALLPEGETGRELIVPDYYKNKSYAGRAEMMELVVYDVTDRSAPKETSRLAQEGVYVSSRMSDH
ncbi:MAG: beta-propeller domain-containing protein, partial [Oscillospiraceae bacterium]